MKCLMIFGLGLFIAAFGFAQENNHEIIPQRGWGISITPNILQRTSIDNRGEKYQLGSSPQIGGEILIKHYYTFAAGYNLVFAGGVNWVSYDFDYDIPGDLFTPPTRVNISSNQALSRHPDIFHLRGQIELERQFPMADKRTFVVAIGASLLYSPQDIESAREVILYPSGSSITFLYRDQTNNNNNRPWINFHLAAGPDWRLGRRQKLQLQVKANFSPVKFLRGTYHMEVGNEPIESGQYGVSGSYLGLSLTYSFSKT